MKAATPANITSGLRSAGIWPFDMNVFYDADFTSSLPTEQPSPQPDNPDVFHGKIPTNSGAQHGEGIPIQRTEEQQCNKTPVKLGVNVKGFTPPSLSKKGKSMIAISTPKLKRLIEDEEVRKIKKNRTKGTKRKLSI